MDSSGNQVDNQTSGAVSSTDNNNVNGNSKRKRIPELPGKYASTTSHLSAMNFHGPTARIHDYADTLIASAIQNLQTDHPALCLMDPKSHKAELNPYCVDFWIKRPLVQIAEIAELSDYILTLNHAYECWREFLDVCDEQQISHIEMNLFFLYTLKKAQLTKEERQHLLAKELCFTKHTPFGFYSLFMFIKLGKVTTDMKETIREINNHREKFLKLRKEEEKIYSEFMN